MVYKIQFIIKADIYIEVHISGVIFFLVHIALTEYKYLDKLFNWKYFRIFPDTIRNRKFVFKTPNEEAVPNEKQTLSIIETNFSCESGVDKNFTKTP